MRTEMALQRDRELMPERRRRLRIRDAQHRLLKRILHLRAQGDYMSEIGRAVGLSRTRIGQILRAAKARGEAA